MLSNLIQAKLYLYKILLFPVFVSNIDDLEFCCLVLLCTKSILSSHPQASFFLGANAVDPPSG